MKKMSEEWTQELNENEWTLLGVMLDLTFWFLSTNMLDLIGQCWMDITT